MAEATDAQSLMKAFSLTLGLFLSVLFAATTSVFADPPKPVAEHPFFKHLIGKWTAEGTLTNQEGNPVKYSAEWTGTATDESTFTIEGTRQIGDSNQSYSWTYTQDPSTGLLEVTHVSQNDTGNPMRFEVSFNEAALSLDFSAFLNSSNSKVILKENFEGDSREKMLTDAQFLDDNGVTTLSGVITNTKSPAL